MKALPIGIQDFEKLRNANAVYVDKTKHIWNLVATSTVYFLSRPRRFGKSLLVNTLEELFQGKKQLFEGLYIYDKWDWSKTYPVIHLDFAGMAYSSAEELKFSLSKFLELEAKRNNVEIDKELPLSMKFIQLIERLQEKAGEKVVILVDEYDKPLMDNFEKKEVYLDIKRTLHEFYQVIKLSDKHLRFVFLTGVSKFSGLSVFSGLNNLNDITMNYKYATICGYTQEELESNFKEYIEEAGKYLEINYDETIRMIKHWYNGYSWDGKLFVYNPFSTLLFFDNKKFEEYWFETGTPTFLIEQIKKNNDLNFFTKGIKTESNSLRRYGSDKVETIALLFQTGYLTIKKEEATKGITQYTLDFPNIEVKAAFLDSLVEEYCFRESNGIKGINESIAKALKEKSSEGLQKSLTELFANIPYDLATKKESYYHSLFLVAARLSGFETIAEEHTDKGRIDAVLKKDNNVIVVEIKYSKDNKTDKIIKEAMEQIKDKKYYEKYIGSDISLLAIVFDFKKEISCRFQSLK
jgi:hypothetical protein